MTFKMTSAARDVLLALADHDVERGSYGNELARETGRAVGTVYPLLAKMERAGIVVAAWEQIDPHVEGRPAIRFWRFTPDGLALVEADRSAQLAKLSHRRLALDPPGSPS